MISINIAEFVQSKETLPIPKGVQRGRIEFNRESTKNAPANLNPQRVEPEDKDVAKVETKEENGRTINRKTKKDGTVEVQVLVKN